MSSGRGSGFKSAPFECFRQAVARPSRGPTALSSSGRVGIVLARRALMVELVSVKIESGCAAGIDDTIIEIWNSDPMVFGPSGAGSVMSAEASDVFKLDRVGCQPVSLIAGN